jgi:DNA-binding transcriptional regulator LsrR (DeoR family)
MAAVALLTVEGAKTSEIKETLDLSEREVARLRDLAGRERLLSQRVELGPGWTRAHEVAAKELLRRSDPRLRELLGRADRAGLIVAPLSIRVFPTVGADWQMRLTEFGRACAGHVRRLIQSTQSVGFTWGESLYSVCRGVEGLPQADGQKRRIVRMFPVCGEPFGGRNIHSASMIASRFAEAINGPGESVPSLASMPLMVPLDFRDAKPERSKRDPEWLSEVEVVKKLAGLVDAQFDIFGRRLRASGSSLSGRQRAWVDRVSMIVTSVGQENLPFGRIQDDVLKPWGLARERVRSIAAAEIAGLLLPRPDDELSAVDRQLLARIEDHWLGIPRKALLECAARARRKTPSSRSAGVVVVAAGKSKASGVLECMRPRQGGLVSHLVCDSDLDVRLRELIGRELRGRSLQ